MSRQSFPNWTRLQDHELTKKEIDERYERARDDAGNFEDYRNEYGLDYHNEPIYIQRAKQEMGDGVPVVMVKYIPVNGNDDLYPDGKSWTPNSKEEQYVTVFKPDTEEESEFLGNFGTQKEAIEKANDFIRNYEGRTVHTEQKFDKVWEYRDVAFVDDNGETKEDYVGDGDGATRRNHFTFSLMPPSVARELMTGTPNIEPTASHNESPEAQEMVKLAEKYDGYVGGYVITESRTDSRIQITEFYADINRKEAERLVGKYRPDNMMSDEEIQPINPETWNGKDVPSHKNKLYRFWWD